MRAEQILRHSSLLVGFSLGCLAFLAPNDAGRIRTGNLFKIAASADQGKCAGKSFAAAKETETLSRLRG